jgi:hypothetical protein
MTVLASPGSDCCAKSPGCHHQLPYSRGTVPYNVLADWYNDDSSSLKIYNGCAILLIMKLRDRLSFPTIKRI